MDNVQNKCTVILGLIVTIETIKVNLGLLNDKFEVFETCVYGMQYAISF